MTMKWTMEAVFAAVAIIFSAGGGIGTSVYNSGKASAQIVQLQQRADATESHVAKHDDQLSTIQQQNAAAGQALTDIKSQLDRIEKKL